MNDHNLVSLGRRLTDLAAECPTRTALVMAFAKDRRCETLSFQDLEDRANRTARYLSSKGVGEGDVVAMALPNCFDYFVVSFAVWKLGGCIFPLRWDLPAWERDKLLETAAPVMLVGGTRDANITQLLREELIQADSFSEEPLPDVTPLPFRMNATGGSTGTPKIVVSRLPGAVDPEQVHGPGGKMRKMAPYQTQLVAGPLYHFGPSSNAVYGLMDAHTIIVLEGFDPMFTLKLIQDYKVEIGMLVPTMLYRILTLPESQNADFSHVKRMTIAGASCAQWLFRKAIDTFGGEQIWTGYGGTENIGTTSISGTDWLRIPGSVGPGIATEIRIFDEDRRELAPGETGMIWMKMEGVDDPFFDYLGAERDVTADGFASLGDMGWLDEAGNLFIADRRSDMFISGGANVYPAEVEAVLLEHPGVMDAVVVGLPDDEWGARCHGIVVAADSGNKPEEEELVEFCRERLARYKVPRAIEFVGSLPRDTLGKIRRSQLRDERSAS